MGLAFRTCRLAGWWQRWFGRFCSWVAGSAWGWVGACICCFGFDVGWEVAGGLKFWVLDLGLILVFVTLFPAVYW